MHIWMNVWDQGANQPAFCGFMVESIGYNVGVFITRRVVRVGGGAGGGGIVKINAEAVGYSI